MGDPDITEPQVFCNTGWQGWESTCCIQRHKLPADEARPLSAVQTVYRHHLCRRPFGFFKMQLCWCTPALLLEVLAIRMICPKVQEGTAGA